MEDTVKMTGKLTLVLRDANGNIKDQRTVPNMVVTTGKNLIASRLKDATSSAATHMSVGTSSTAVNAGQTALSAEVSPRVALTSTAVVGNVITFTATFSPGVGSGALVEAGVFNALTSGSMLCRTVFSVVTKDVLDTLTIVWNLTIN